MTTTTTPGLEFALVKESDLDELMDLELAGYPADEAATPASMAKRVAEAGDIFLVARPASGGPIVAFVCSTRTSSVEYTHEAMEQHEAGTSSVCIHSVCVDKRWRRRGVARAALAEYVRRCGDGSFVNVKRAMLICKEHLIPLYKGAGFTLVGPSAVVHGQDPWFDMAMDF